MRFIQGVILLIFLGAILIFALQNSLVVKVQFLNWYVAAPLSLISVAVYFLGMMSGWTVVAFLRRSIRKVSERQD